MLLTLGHQKNSGLDHGLEQQSPVTSVELHTSPTGSLQQRHCSHVYPIRASQERLRGPPHPWEKRQGETSPEEDGVENSPWSCPSPPEATYSNPAEMVRYGLEVAARWCAKGTWVHPPALYHGRDTLLQKAFLPRGVQNNSQEVSKITPRGQEKSCLEWFLPKENQSRVGTPESQDRDADGQTDILLKEKEKAKEVPV